MPDARAERTRLIESLLKRPSGQNWCGRNTELVDSVISSTVLQIPGADQASFCLAAVGGYGRKELCPYSDIDIAFIPGRESGPELDQLAKQLFKELHAVVGGELGLNIGYSYRAASDMPGLDGKSRTGLLDARIIFGDPDVLADLQNALWDTFPVAEFLIEKIAERNYAFRTRHDSPLVTQPHLKEGAGGLRSFHAANWIGAALGERPNRSSRSYDFVLKVRNLMHALAGKPQDLLSHERRVQVAAAMGVTPKELGAELAGAMDELHQEYLKAIGRISVTRFFVTPHIEAIRGELRIGAKAAASEAAIAVALATKLNLHVEDVRSALTARMNGAEAMKAVSSGEPTLRNLDRCGVLEQILPELTSCRTLMPGDAVHEFTVFEHTLRVVRNIDRAEGLLAEIKMELTDLGPLYLAALLHDVGKADPTVEHSIGGAAIARQVCTRWGLSDRDTELVEWLVREHLTLSKFIRMRDVMNVETAFDFAKIVKHEDRLACLALLTWADASAVGENVWTPVQQTFLEELFNRTREQLRTEGELPDQSSYRRRIRRSLEKADIPADELAAFVDSLPGHYLLSTESRLIRQHYDMMKEAEKNGPQVEFVDYKEIGLTDIYVCSADQQGVLSSILGVLYAFDLGIVTIRASTTNAARPMILDMISVNYAGRCVPTAISVQLGKALTSVLSGRTSANDLLKEKEKDPNRSQQIFRWNFLSGDPAIVEFQAPRGRGMGYRLSKLISEQGWNVLAARVGQWAGRGAASFYVVKADGSPVELKDVETAFGSQKV